MLDSLDRANVLTAPWHTTRYDTQIVADTVKKHLWELTNCPTKITMHL